MNVVENKSRALIQNDLVTINMNVSRMEDFNVSQSVEHRHFPKRIRAC